MNDDLRIYSDAEASLANLITETEKAAETVLLAFLRARNLTEHPATDLLNEHDDTSLDAAVTHINCALKELNSLSTSMKEYDV